MVKFPHDNEKLFSHAGRDEIIPYRLMKSEWIDLKGRGLGVRSRRRGE